MKTTNPLEPLFIREVVFRSIRKFFEEKKFHEMITPYLSTSFPLEPNIYPFSTTWETPNGSTELYLSTSPEGQMKKLLALGVGNCFSIGKCFRNLEGAGSQHTPEFIMLEWYRENAEYEAIIQDNKELILFIKKGVDEYLQRPYSSQLKYQGDTIDLHKEWPVFSLVELFKKYAGLDLGEILEEKILFQKSKEKGYATDNASWTALYDQILVNEIEPHLPKTPFYIIDFPARLSPLCSVKKSDPRLADRFEFYMAGMELANGNNENTDSQYVRSLFEKEREYRKKSNLKVPPIDEGFLDALQKMSVKKYAGIGLGLDRLAMIMADMVSISGFTLD